MGSFASPLTSAVAAAGTTTNSGAVWLRASDPNVQCGVHARRGPADPLEVFVKFRCGASPAVTRFLVLVYAPPPTCHYHATPLPSLLPSRGLTPPPATFL